jgi:fluoride exporter
VSGLYLAVAAAGAVGAPARYLVDLAVQERGRRHPELPLGTLAVNVSGSFLLGLVTGLALHHGLPAGARTTLGTGFCGAYTTFSTFSYETIRLVQDGDLAEAGLNVLASLAAGAVAAAAGLGLALVA